MRDCGKEIQLTIHQLADFDDKFLVQVSLKYWTALNLLNSCPYWDMLKNDFFFFLENVANKLFL